MRGDQAGHVVLRYAVVIPPGSAVGYRKLKRVSVGQRLIHKVAQSKHMRHTEPLPHKRSAQQ